MSSLLLLLLLLQCASPSLSAVAENELVTWLMDGYNREERPVRDESQPVELSVKLELRQILDLDEKNQVLKTNMWLHLSWTDFNLRWNEVKS